MIFNSFFTQIVMAVLALGIIFTYIQPTFTKIGSIQSAILQYQVESSKVSEVINGLANLVSKVNAVSSSDLKALLIYMPDKVDHVAVSRDLLTMSEEAGAYLESVEYNGILADKARDPEDRSLPVVKHTFTVNLSGSYDQTKLFMSMLEQNNYPLEIHELNITSTETGLINSDMTIVTYSHI